jgi:hypothetical protein
MSFERSYSLWLAECVVVGLVLAIIFGFPVLMALSAALVYWHWGFVPEWRH